MLTAMTCSLFEAEEELVAGAMRTSRSRLAARGARLVHSRPISSRLLVVSVASGGDGAAEETYDDRLLVGAAWRGGACLLSRWSIRNKLLLGLALLLAIVVTLSWSGFDGLYAHRSLLSNLRRVNELPLATELGHRVSDLRVAALDHPRGFEVFEESDALSLPDARF